MTPRKLPLAPDRHVVLGLVGVTAALILYALAYAGVVPRLFEPSSRTVTAVFANSQQLTAGDPVRIGGVVVGKVTSVTAEPSARSATVEMAVRRSAGPLYADAAGAIRWRTVLGGSFAVDLERGTETAGELGGGVIPASRTTNQVELEDVTRALTADAREGMQTTFHELPRALADKQALGAALDRLVAVAPAVTAGVGALRGEHRDADLRDLVSGAARTARALDTPDDDLRGLVAEAGTTFAATARRSDDIATTISSASRVLPRTSATLARLRSTLRDADPLVDALRRSAGDIGPTAAKLRSTALAADDVLQDAAPLVRTLRPTALALASAAHTGIPLLDAVAPGLKRLEDKVLPDLAKKSPESRHATYEMIGPTIAGLLGASSHFDENTWFVRFTGNGGDRALDTSSCRGYVADPNASALLRCQSLQKSLKTVVRALQPHPPTKGRP